MKFYHKEPSKIAHGWSVLRPNGEFICWQSDAAVAQATVDELNKLVRRADAARNQTESKSFVRRNKPR